MDKNIFEKEFKAIGTDIYIQVVADESEKNKVYENFAKIERIYQKQNMILSRFTQESEISKLNNKLGEFNEVSESILYLVQKSLKYYQESDGFYDPRILENLEGIGYREDFGKNEFKNKCELEEEIFRKDLSQDLIIVGNKVKFERRMDFTGIAKGYITDRVAEFLKANNWGNFLVDSGGDMYARGRNKRGDSWGISLEESKNEDEILVEISNQGLATSGVTRKHWQIGNEEVHHLINPKNVNNFNFDLKSVTAIAETTERADMLAKVLFMMGLVNGVMWAKKNKIKSIFLKNNQEIIKLNI